MDLEIRALNEAERMYTYTQSQQIRSMCGNIGYLRADMDSDGNGFFSSWSDFRDDLKTQDFKDEFDDVINSLRFDDTDEAFLKNRSTLATYCFSHMDALMDDEQSFGVRVDTQEHAYMMRLNPNRGEYNLYCYCYKKEWLDNHLNEAEKGIRFIDSHYHELFRIPDGGKIQITHQNGEKDIRSCRYIDNYHVEIGGSSTNLYHICEFAERIESMNAKIDPIGETLEMKSMRHLRR